MSNQRYLPVLVSEIELIISQKQYNKQRRAAKSNERQMETLPKIQNEQQRAFPFSFICLNSGPMKGG